MNVCDEEEKDMTIAEAPKIVAKDDSIPSERNSHISKALKEVELMEQEKITKKSARSFLKELRDEK